MFFRLEAIAGAALAGDNWGCYMMQPNEVKSMIEVITDVEKTKIKGGKIRIKTRDSKLNFLR